jgi:hypothetical protein
MWSWSKILSGGVFFEERKPDLVVVRGLSPMNFRMALPAHRE